MIKFYRILPLLGLLPVLWFSQTTADVAADVSSRDVSDGAVTLEDAWVRALPPTQSRTAAYLTIYNQGASAIEVRGATAELAGRTEIHTSREVDGLMRMEQLSGLSVAAGQRESLAPGGTHLMLLELERMPVPGDSVELCLQLAAGEAVCTRAPVRKSATGNEHQHHH